MNAHLKVLTRLLLAILLISLVSTIFLGNRIHRRVVVSIEQPTQRVRPSQGNITKIPLWAITIAQSAISQNELNKIKLNILILPVPKGIRKDWHDYEAMKEDSLRIGLGEQGKPAELNDPLDEELINELQDQHGFNGLLSDRISLNRSLPDARPVG